MTDKIIIDNFNLKLTQIFNDICGGASHLFKVYKNDNPDLESVNFHHDGMMYIFFLMWREIDKLTKSGFWTPKEILVILLNQHEHEINICNDISNEFYDLTTKLLQHKMRDLIENK